MQASALAGLLIQIATILIVAGGIAVILRARSLARMLLLSGFAAAIASALLPSLLQIGTSVGPLDVFALASSASGLISLLCGKFRAALTLFWPSFSQWLLWPLLTPYLSSHWTLIALMLAPLSIFILIWVQQQILVRVYGEHAAGHVTGVYLVRALDATGRGLGWLIALPFRLVFFGSRRR